MTEPFQLKIWRCHPQASPILPAEKTLHGTANPNGVKWCGPYSSVNKTGFWLFPAIDVDITWLGGNKFDYHFLQEYSDADYHLVRELLTPTQAENADKWSLPGVGRTKFTWGLVEPGVIQMWTGCLKKGTRILTPSGYVKIESLVGKKTDVVTEFGIKSAENVFFQGIKKTFKILTSTGGRITVSEDHKFKIMSSDGLKWTTANKIKCGDRILCCSGDSGILPEDNKESIEFWYALGCLYGDGAISEKGTITWIIPQTEFATFKRITKLLDSLKIYHWQSVNLSKDKRVNASVPVWYLNVGKYNPFVKKLPLYQQKGNWRSEGFPEHFWSLGKKQMCALLSGLFNTDGHIRKDKGNIHFYTSRRKIAKDVREMLLLLGMVSVITKRAKRTTFGITREYKVSLLGSKSHEVFNDKIKFHLDTKKYNENLRPRKRYDRFLGIPFVNEILNKLFKNEICSKFHYLDKNQKVITEAIRRILKNKSSFLPDSMLGNVLKRAEELELHDTLEYNFLKNYIDNNWWFDEILSVKEDDLAEVYDPVNVCETHSYVAAGFVSHNCIFQTPPGWCLQVRSPINFTPRSMYVMEGIIETDWMQYDIWTNLVFTEPNQTVQLRRDGWPPLAQLVPIRRESFAEQWSCSVEEINRNTPEANQVFDFWVQYNEKKFAQGGKQRLSTDGVVTKDSTTYHKEKMRLLGRAMEPKINPQQTKTVVYIVNNKPNYVEMALYSLQMLRHHNKTCPVTVILIDGTSEITDKFLPYAQVIQRPWFQPEQNYFPLNKYWLGEIPETNVLYLDADTFINDDIEKLFDRYQADFTACENTWVWQQGWQKEWLVKSPWNSGVILFKNSYHQILYAKLLDACAEIIAQKTSLSKWLMQNNPWVREEFATSILVANDPIKSDYFQKKDCHNIRTLQDVIGFRDSIVFHSYTPQWVKVRQFMQQVRKMVWQNIHPCGTNKKR